MNGAYFHDIGKMLKPGYFVENMSEGAESRHEHLAPAMSTLIIIGHVKDGADLESPRTS
jgi:putative nucleotidyltransferase with HDIG domain